MNKDPIQRDFSQGSIFPRQVGATADISAPIDAVWKVLVDFEHYCDWNVFTPKIETDLRTGSAVQLQVNMPNRSRSSRTEWINLIEPGETICWGMHLAHPLLLCSNRSQTLVDLGNGHTQYSTVNKFSGVLVPLVLALYAKPMQQAFQSVALNLKQRVETLEAG